MSGREVAAWLIARNWCLRHAEIGGSLKELWDVKHHKLHDSVTNVGNRRWELCTGTRGVDDVLQIDSLPWAIFMRAMIQEQGYERA